MAVKIKIRRGTSAQWASSTRVLDQGELGLDTTLNKIKVGNGVLTWGSLPFLQADIDTAELSQDAIALAFANGTHSNITVTYDDVANKISLATGPNVVTTTSLSNTLTNATTGYVPVGDVGQADGVASLGPNGKIPDSEIPSTIARDSEIPSLTGYATETYVGTAISNLVNAAPAAFDTLKEIADYISSDQTAASAVTTSIALKAPISSPTFTGTVSGITKSMVGLASVDNTDDANKPVSTATQTALGLKLNLSDPAVDYYISNSGSGAYLVNGVSNGLITFEKGKKYRIHVNAAGHPFWIQTVSGAYSSGNVYLTGITNSGAQVGHILVELPQNAPDSLYYVCEYHSSMKGSVSVTDKDVSGPKTVSGSSYTLEIIDLTKTIVTTATSGEVAITVPPQSSVNFPLGTTLQILQEGVGRVVITPGSGVTVNNIAGILALKNRYRYSFINLYKYAENSWIVVGDLTT